MSVNAKRKTRAALEAEVADLRSAIDYIAQAALTLDATDIMDARRSMLVPRVIGTLASYHAGCRANCDAASAACKAREAAKGVA